MVVLRAKLRSLECSDYLVAMETLNTPFSTLNLSRFPKRPKEQLRAWDAADEYILETLDSENLVTTESRILVVNDQFGAITLALADFHPKLISDSWIAHQGCLANAADNQINPEQITLYDSLDYPEATFDLILLKVPKSLAMLEDQLARLHPLLAEGGRLIAGGMVKAIHTSTLKLFEKYIGPTTTSLARKKARLIFPQRDSDITGTQSPFPSRYVLENTSLEITNHAGVFSREKLDIGTRFFLEHLPTSPDYQNIVDLGCGNGVVGVMVKRQNPEAKVTFVDESFMAVASAKANYVSAGGHIDDAEFKVTDCLAGITPNSCDLILNNPPFHQQNTVGDFIALQMFREAKKVLKKQGELWVIGNRHLGYHARLKKLFGNCMTVASNKKFVILKAIKN